MLPALRLRPIGLPPPALRAGPAGGEAQAFRRPLHARLLRPPQARNPHPADKELPVRHHKAAPRREKRGHEDQHKHQDNSRGNKEGPAAPDPLRPQRAPDHGQREHGGEAAPEGQLHQAADTGCPAGLRGPLRGVQELRVARHGAHEGEQAVLCQVQGMRKQQDGGEPEGRHYGEKGAEKVEI